MRTTITLDDDVAARMEQLRQSRHRSFRTRSVDAGRCFIESIVDVAEVLAITEGDAFK
jgi:hypothetical protein